MVLDLQGVAILPLSISFVEWKIKKDTLFFRRFFKALLLEFVVGVSVESIAIGI